MEILAYIFTSLAAATTAQHTIDVIHGIPVNKDAVTKHWVDVSQVEKDNNTIYYIQYDKSLEPILGQPDVLKLPISDL